MSSFFYQTAQTLINQYPDQFPLLKILHLLDTINKKKANYIRDNGGRPAYPTVPMFRVILLGHWNIVWFGYVIRFLSILSISK